MQVNRTSAVTFNAHIPSSLKNKLADEALRKNMYDKFVKQANILENVGYDTSEIVMEQVRGKAVGLSLVNSYLIPFKKAVLPFKDSLLSSFLSLEKKDIIKAQNSLKI